jgi:hypothetical protein
MERAMGREDAPRTHEGKPCRFSRFQGDEAHHGAPRRAKNQARDDSETKESNPNMSHGSGLLSVGCSRIRNALLEIGENVSIAEFSKIWKQDIALLYGRAVEIPQGT